MDGGINDVEEIISLPEDENAFTAFIEAANRNSLVPDIDYYDFDGDGIPESAFVNSINGIGPSADWLKYWQFSINNTPAMAGVSAYIPEEGDRLSLDYLDGRMADAIEWLVDNQENNGALGPNLFQSTFASIALSLAKDNNVEIDDDVINGGLSYIIDQQEEDAGFGDDLSTALAVIALLSNGKTLNSFAVSGITTVENLISNQQSDGGFRSGTTESDVDTTSWATIAIALAWESMPTNNGNSPIDYLLSAQHENGSFGYNSSYQAESIDFTEEAIIAFAAAGLEKNEDVQNAIKWLASRQDGDGCIGDGFRTALGSIAFRAYNEDENAGKAVECLQGMQNGDGSFGRNTNPSNAVDTAIAIIALNEKIFPFTPEGEGTTEGKFGLNTILKFLVRISNVGAVDAENVSVLLSGIPDDWIYPASEGSIDYFDKIEPGKTKTAEIYVKLKETGSYTVNAVISANQLLSSLISNNVSVDVELALLEVSLSIAN